MTSAKKPRKRNLFHLTLAGLDELEMFPTAEARQKALNELPKSTKWWELAFGIAVTAIAAIALTFGLKELFKWVFPNSGRAVREVLDILRLLITMGGVFLVVRALHRWGVERELRQKLLACNVPVCMSCGYLLRGLDAETAVCPECGRAIDETARAILRQKPE